MKKVDVLKQLGLDDKEAKTYLAALEFGPATVVTLAKKSGVKRTSIYNFMDDLVARGLIISSVSGKRTLYSAISPEELERIAEKQVKFIKEAIPEMMLLFDKSPKRPKVRFYEGVEGLKTIFMDSISQPGEYEVLYYASLQDLVGRLSEGFLKEFIDKRVKGGIVAKGILPSDEATSQHYTLDSNENELRETILVPRDELPMSDETMIYGDKIALMSFGDEKIGVIIESSQIADSHRHIFNLLWNMLKREEARGRVKSKPARGGSALGRK